MGPLTRLLVWWASIGVVGRRLNRWLYDSLSRRFGADTDWHFMNHGFDDASFAGRPLGLAPEDEADRRHIQLYVRLLEGMPIERRRVLDVGCGRGGGAACVHRYLGPALTVGVDLSCEAVRLCMARHRAGGLIFVNGDAERLPFADATFDLVVSVESSHAYRAVEAFLREARRVLIPGGHLALADFRWVRPSGDTQPVAGLALLRRQLDGCGLARIWEADLSSGVLSASAADEGRRRAWIGRHVPGSLGRRAFGELLGLPGTVVPEALKAGRLVYWSAVLQKPTPTGP